MSPGRPRKGTRRTVIFPDDDWEAARAKAASEGISLYELVRRALKAELGR